MSQSAFSPVPYPPAYNDDPSDDKTEWHLQLSAQPYLASDPYRVKRAIIGAAQCKEINKEEDDANRRALFKRYLNEKSVDPGNISLPLFFEFGFNITIGKDCWIGPGAMMLDVMPITIGDRTMIGPNVQFYTPTHPLSPEERNGLHGRESANPIKIGSDVWIGGAAIILGGITIGDGCTIGAGTVVTKDVESRCVVVGNPGRVVKRV